MRVSRDLPLLMIALLCVGSAGALLSLVAQRSVAYELLEILMIIAGTTFFSGFALLLSLARQPRAVPLVQISFNGRQLREDLEKVIDADFREVRPLESKPWEPTPERLIAEDPILALAKVRIDLEREVRRIALETGVIKPDQRFDLGRTLEVLEREAVFHPATFSAIRDILPVCNRAVHGEAIDLITARNVVDISREIMTIWQSRYSGHHKDVNTVY